MLLRVYSNRFWRSHTGMVIPHVFHLCWKFLAFDQIQLDAYCAVVWRWFEQLSNWGQWFLFLKKKKKKKKEMMACPRKPRQLTSIGITWHIQPFSTQSSGSVSYRFFFRSCTSSRFSSQGTVNSMRKTLLFESDHATMSMLQWPLFCLNNMNRKL